MIIFVIALVLITLLSLRFAREENSLSEKEGYKEIKKEPFLSQRSTTIINGIFVLLIFCSHSTQYITMNGNVLDSAYSRFQSIHNQWVVTTFLAFSGYGVMLKLQSQGEEYIKKFPRNRLLKTLINFDIAVVLFLIVNLFFDNHYSKWEIAGSFIGITAIGNSNWYIFTILVMYVVSYLAAVFFKKKKNSVALFITVCSIGYVVIAQIFGLPSRFVSTVTTYALGVWIAIYKSELELFFRKRKVISFVLIIIPIILTYKLRGNDYIMNVNSCFFVLLVILFMTQFEIRSNVLYFLGRHAFSIYILQRLPMIIISHYITPTGIGNYVFVAACLLLTICMAVLFDMILEKIDKIIIKA